MIWIVLAVILVVILGATIALRTRLVASDSAIREVVPGRFSQMLATLPSVDPALTTEVAAVMAGMSGPMSASGAVGAGGQLAQTPHSRSSHVGDALVPGGLAGAE